MRDFLLSLTGGILALHFVIILNIVYFRMVKRPFKFDDICVLILTVTGIIAICSMIAVLECFNN